jgi:hypothetical protein
VIEQRNPRQKLPTTEEKSPQTRCRRGFRPLLDCDRCGSSAKGLANDCRRGRHRRWATTPVSVSPLLIEAVDAGMIMVRDLRGRDAESGVSSVLGRVTQGPRGDCLMVHLPPAVPGRLVMRKSWKTLGSWHPVLLDGCLMAGWEIAAGKRFR